MTQDPRAHGAIDTLLWLGAGVLAFFLILLFWLANGVQALAAALRRTTTAPDPEPGLPGRPAGI